MAEPLTAKELEEFKRTAEGMHDRIVLRLLATIAALVGAITGPTLTGSYCCRLCGASPYEEREKIVHAPQCALAPGERE